MIKSNEIKQIARNKLAGNWGKAISISAIYVAITFALSYCSTLIQNLTLDTPILYYSAQIIFALVLLPLSFGFISTMIKLLNGKNPSYTTVINDAVLNSSKAIGIFFRTFLKIFIPSVLVIIGAVAIFFLVSKEFPLNWNTLGGYLLLLILLYIISAIIIFILTLPYVLSSYALANDNTLSAKEAIEQSIDLMNGNKWNFVKLFISFIGWFILICIVISLVQNYAPSVFKDLVQALGSIFILPYIISSISVFYDELNDTKVETAETIEKD